MEKATEVNEALLRAIELGDSTSLMEVQVARTDFLALLRPDEVQVSRFMRGVIERVSWEITKAEKSEFVQDRMEEVFEWLRDERTADSLTIAL